MAHKLVKSVFLSLLVLPLCLSQLPNDRPNTAWSTRRSLSHKSPTVKRATPAAVAPSASLLNHSTSSVEGFFTPPEGDAEKLKHEIGKPVAPTPLGGNTAAKIPNPEPSESSEPKEHLNPSKSGNQSAVTVAEPPDGPTEGSPSAEQHSGSDLPSEDLSHGSRRKGYPILSYSTPTTQNTGLSETTFTLNISNHGTGVLQVQLYLPDYAEANKKHFKVKAGGSFPVIITVDFTSSGDTAAVLIIKSNGGEASFNLARPSEDQAVPQSLQKNPTPSPSPTLNPLTPTLNPDSVPVGGDNGGDSPTDEGDNEGATPAGDNEDDSNSGAETPADRGDRGISPADDPSDKEDEAPAESADAPPTDDTSADDSPTDATPADATPADDTSADDSPTDATPADDTSADDTPADDAPADTKSADDTSADDAPTDTKSADDTSADDTSADNAPTDATPTDDSSADDKAGNEEAAPAGHSEDSQNVPDSSKGSFVDVSWILKLVQSEWSKLTWQQEAYVAAGAGGVILVAAMACFCLCCRGSRQRRGGGGVKYTELAPNSTTERLSSSGRKLDWDEDWDEDWEKDTKAKVPDSGLALGSRSESPKTRGSDSSSTLVQSPKISSVAAKQSPSLSLPKAASANVGVGKKKSGSKLVVSKGKPVIGDGWEDEWRV